MNKTPITMTTIIVIIGILILNSASALISVDNKTIGQSYQKRPIITTVIKDTSCQDNKVYAFITQQHGSEWSGRQIVNGMVNELLKNKDSIVCKEYHFILNTNPDGIVKNIRYNAKGIDLNRVWDSSESAAWETKYSRKYFKDLDTAEGIDVFTDVHGYNGVETQSEIFYQNQESKELCEQINPIVAEFECVYALAVNKNAKWYAVNKLNIPVVFTIEPIQKMSVWSKSYYQDIGKRLIDLI